MYTHIEQPQAPYRAASLCTTTSHNSSYTRLYYSYFLTGKKPISLFCVSIQCRRLITKSTQRGEDLICYGPTSTIAKQSRIVLRVHTGKKLSEYCCRCLSLSASGPYTELQEHVYISPLFLFWYINALFTNKLWKFVVRF